LARSSAADSSSGCAPPMCQTCAGTLLRIATSTSYVSRCCAFVNSGSEPGMPLGGIASARAAIGRRYGAMSASWRLRIPYAAR
jgi:hypothetical protein